jgi:hypothetical protein
MYEGKADAPIALREEKPMQQREIREKEKRVNRWRVFYVLLRFQRSVFRYIIIYDHHFIRDESHMLSYLLIRTLMLSNHLQIYFKGSYSDGICI